MYGINENNIQFNEPNFKDKLKMIFYDIIDDLSEEDLYYLLTILYYINNEKLSDLHILSEKHKWFIYFKDFFT